jgi:hypothetical protein
LTLTSKRGIEFRQGRPISMADEQRTYIVKKRDLADIIHLEDAGALEVFLQNPLGVIAQATVEFFSHGPKALVGPGVRIVQGALKGNLFKRLAMEVEDLRKKGKIDENFGETKYGFQSWVELLSIIDEDTPDEDRLEALKAMFYSINKVNATDAEQILGYQLFQIAKKLTSNELLVLKAAYELRNEGKTTVTGQGAFRDWAQAVSGHLGHSLISLIDHADRALVENQLLTDRFHGDRSGISWPNWRLTDLGLRFCENIERYKVQKRP